MLKITIPAAELFDGRENFIQTKEQTLQLEHSLVSLSKWESKWHKPYLSTKAKTMAESRDYIRCMTLTQNVDPNVYLAISPEIFKQINAYIDDPMTATTITKRQKGGGSGEKVTAEVIYYWMICYGIPFECQKWHLNRLIMLVNVCDAKGSTPKKMPMREMLAQRRALNAARRKKYNTRG